MEEKGYVIAFVGSVIQDGKHGAYATVKDVAEFHETCAHIKEVVDDGGSVTFSLKPPEWRESDFPGPGTKVVLSDFREKRKGWRAMSARYFRPADQQPRRGRKRA